MEKKSNGQEQSLQVCPKRNAREFLIEAGSVALEGAVRALVLWTLEGAERVHLREKEVSEDAKHVEVKSKENAG